MDGNAFARHHDVVADKGVVLAQLCRFSVHIKALIGKLAAQARVGKQVADAALYIHPAVGARCAGERRKLVEIFLLLQEVERQRLQHPAAFLEGKPAQLRAADGAGVMHHRAEVEAFGGSGVDSLAVDGVVKRLTGGFCGAPGAFGVVFKLGNH